MNPKRLELMECLGGQKCKQCSVSDIRVLEIDHIFGNGQEMPLSKTGILEYYLENPDFAFEELQVLCANCHKIKTLINHDRTGRNKIRKYEENYGIVVSGEDIPKNNLENMDWYG